MGVREVMPWVMHPDLTEANQVDHARPFRTWWSRAITPLSELFVSVAIRTTITTTISPSSSISEFLLFTCVFNRNTVEAADWLHQVPFAHTAAAVIVFAPPSWLVHVIASRSFTVHGETTRLPPHVCGSNSEYDLFQSSRWQITYDDVNALGSTHTR